MAQLLRSLSAGAVAALVALASLFTGYPAKAAETAAAPPDPAAPDQTVAAPTSAADNEQLPPGVRRIRSVEGITEYELSNGLRVLLAPDQSKPTTTVNMTYLVGSRHENYGETGMAHLLEHMLFKGTHNIRNALAEFSRRGLRANGTTSQDRTNYFASFAADPDTLRWYLGWQADAMINSTILRSDLDTEMTVVRNEMERGENDPFRILLEKMQSVAFQWHNYGKSTIGARSDVENVDIDQLRKFYRQYYQPDNAVLIVSGKFDVRQTLADIARDFGRIPRPERKLPPQYTVEPVQDGERSVTVRRAGGVPLVAAMYHSPQAGSPESVAIDALATIMGDTPSGRLYHQLVVPGKAAEVFGFAFDRRDPSTVIFGAQLEPSMDQYTALWTLIDTVESVMQAPITEEELERARNKLLLDWDRVYSDPQRLGVALSEAIAAGDWRLFFKRRDWIRDLKVEDVQRAAERWLVRSNRTEGRYVPTEKPVRAPAPEEIDLDALLKDYTGNPDYREIEPFDPTPENIDARTERRSLELANGRVEMALLPKATRGSRVSAQFKLRFGDLESLRGQRLASQATAALLDRGTRTMSRQEIQDRFDQLEANVAFAGAGTDVVVSMSTKRDNLPAVVALVLDILRNATFPEDQVEEYKRSVLAALNDAMTDPNQLAMRALARHANPWPKDDPRYIPTFGEAVLEIENLKREALVAFHEWFYGAGNMYFTAVGDFDANEVQKALADGLAGWQPAPPFKRIPDPYHEVPAERFVIDTPDKANAFYAALLPFALQDTDPDYVPLYLANHMLGLSETSRLWMRIRETEGLSYDVRSILSVSSYEPSADWTFYAIYPPDTLQRLEQAFNEEIDRVLTDGFTENEVKEGVQALLRQRQLSRAQDGVLASVWLEYLQLGRTFAWSADIDRKLQALTADDVNGAVRKYLDPSNLSSAIAGDFTRAAAGRAASQSGAKPAPSSSNKNGRDAGRKRN